MITCYGVKIKYLSRDQISKLQHKLDVEERENREKEEERRKEKKEEREEEKKMEQEKMYIYLCGRRTEYLSHRFCRYKQCGH